MIDYPEDARCAVEGCGHKRKRHDDIGCSKCLECHGFAPIRLCGGAYTKREERVLYRRALQGDSW